MNFKVRIKETYYFAFFLSLLAFSYPAAAEKEEELSLLSIINSARGTYVTYVLSASCARRSTKCQHFEYELAGGKQAKWSFGAVNRVSIGKLSYVIDMDGRGYILEIDAVPVWDEKTDSWGDSYWVGVPTGISTEGIDSIDLNVKRCFTEIGEMHVAGPNVCRFRKVLKLSDIMMKRRLSKMAEQGSE